MACRDDKMLPTCGKLTTVDTNICYLPATTDLHTSYFPATPTSQSPPTLPTPKPPTLPTTQRPTPKTPNFQTPNTAHQPKNQNQNKHSRRPSPPARQRVHFAPVQVKHISVPPWYDAGEFFFDRRRWKLCQGNRRSQLYLTAPF